jgi:hypothetical protein
MNMYAAIGLGTVALIAAAALFVAGQTVLAGVALAIGVVFDVLFVIAVRDAGAARKKT